MVLLGATVDLCQLFVWGTFTVYRVRLKRFNSEKLSRRSLTHPLELFSLTSKPRSGLFVYERNHFIAIKEDEKPKTDRYLLFYNFSIP
jgi:hypothetical protein